MPQHQVDIADEFVDALVRETNAEVVGGDLLKLMGLIEDDGGGLRQDTGIWRADCLLLDAEIGEEQMVIDDDDVGLSALRRMLVMKQRSQSGQV